MASDTTVAIGPLGQEDYQKLLVDAQGRLIATTAVTGLFNEGRITIMSLDDTAWVELPPSVLAGRNSISLQNQSDNGGTLLLNYTDAAPGNEGIRIEDGETRVMTLGGIRVYGRMAFGTGTVAVEEIA